MTRQIKVGKLRIGGGAPIVIQSMAKTDTRDVTSTIKQIRELENAGCELVRVAVKDFEAANAIKDIKKKIRIPLSADIHFDYRLAIRALEKGTDKIRLNPGNIYKENEVKEVVKLAKRRRIPIRVGVNSGSVGRTEGRRTRDDRRGMRDDGRDGLADRLVKSALGYVKILEKMDFYDIIVSLKASDVLTTIEACRIFSKKSDYPLHLGITAAGPVSTGLVKSSIGIGVLLLEGIGDTIRVSLTGEPCEEVKVAKNILQSLNLRRFGPEIISCPTCGRCQVDLQRIVREIENRYVLRSMHYAKTKFSTIAIMGCEVNGPGEAKEADIGVACGKGSAVLFRRGKIIRRAKERDIVKEILEEIV